MQIGINLVKKGITQQQSVWSSLITVTYLLITNIIKTVNCFAAVIHACLEFTHHLHLDVLIRLVGKMRINLPLVIKVLQRINQEGFIDALQQNLLHSYK